MVGSARRGRRSRGALVAAVLAALVGLISACSSGGEPPLPKGPYSSRPNIVFVLTDDLDTGLVRYMPHVLALEKAGMTFSNYTVTDSLCCPSRASIFSGKFPHDTDVYGNAPPNGGFGTFYLRGEEQHTFATALQAAGYRTAMMGKYLNAYPVGANAYNYPTDYVAPGWDQWDVASNGYGEFKYNLNRNHDLVTYGDQPSDYLTAVLSGFGQQFIRTSAAARSPFLLEVATFSPHSPYTAAPRDRDTFTNLALPEGPAFNRLPAHSPPWLGGRPRLGPVRIANLQTAYIKRVQAVQSVDRMVGALESTLAASGQLKNTVFVFSSDNGYHLGQHGLGAGKLTAFDTDVRVPLIVMGPGIPAGTVNRDITENIDLAPTFEQLAGVTPPPSVDGRSLVPLLHGNDPPWRTLALIEHRGPDMTPGDPDAQTTVNGNPPTYNAIRSAHWTYVRYVHGAREFYDRRTDPYEDHNVAGSLSPSRLATLNGELAALTHCHGATSCWQAALPRTTATS